MRNRNMAYANELLIEAIGQKKVDLNKAIKLYEEAISINKKLLGRNNTSLASCYFNIGNPEKAYLILFNHLKYLKERSFYAHIQFFKSEVYYRICVLLYQEHRYLEYIYHYSLMTYNAELSIFITGSFDEYKFLKKTWGLFQRFYHSKKIITCFRRIDKLEKFGDFGKKN